MSTRDIDNLLNELEDAANGYDAERVDELSKLLIDELANRTLQDPGHSVHALKILAEANDAEKILSISNNLTANLRDDPTPNARAFTKQLELSVSRFNRERTGHLCDRLKARLLSDTTLYSVEDCTSILKVLRRKRYFDEMIEVADVMLQIGRDDPTVQLLYAQALLDTGKISIAISILESLKYPSTGSGSPSAYNEACGLLGRAYKQVFCDATSKDRNRDNQDLRRRVLSNAIQSYAEVYERDSTKSWHGVNTVSLLARAERDNIDLSPTVGLDYRQTAREIREHFGDPSDGGQDQVYRNSKSSLSMWDCASAAEACLADNKHLDDAVLWTAQYTSDEHNCNADAFEYASTLRQFEDICQLDPGHEKQGKILELLRSALIRKEGGRINVSHADKQLSNAQAIISDVRFEAVLGAERYKTLRWYELGLKRAMGVARIVDKTDHALGTGFLLRGEDVHPQLENDWVMMTNAHVISVEQDELNPREGPPARRPEDVGIIFDTGANKDKRFSVKKLLYSSGRFDLDCSIISITGGDIDLQTPFRVARNLPPVNKEQRVYVIGHPMGGGLAFSIDDNLLLDHDNTRIHYRAPTEPGSSGSPVFNRDWDLIGLHHFGGDSVNRLNNRNGTYPANEGISIQKILVDSSPHLMN